MKILDKHPELILNVVKVKGELKCMFYSHVAWVHLGSKRSLVELLTGEYIPEVDIDIIALTAKGIPLVEQD